MKAPTPSRWFTFALVFGMLLTGSINTVSKKLGYDTCSQGISGVTAVSGASEGCDGDERKFHKPWTQTLVMFTGESMCIFLFLRNRSANNRRARAVQESQRVSLRSALVCIVPALCDLGGTTLSGIGLLFTTASVFQMLRGSIILFTAIFSIFFLKRKVFGYQWLGILITVAGISLVGVSSFMSSSNSSSSSTTMVMVGNGLVILSQTMSAFQMVIEEKFLKNKNLPPELVVGCEGIFGVIAMLAVVLPLVYHIPFGSCSSDWCLDGEGIHENALDAAVLVSHNSLLACLVGMYFMSIAMYNWCGLAVAKSLSSLHRTLIDACRTIVVWCVDLIIYQATSGRYGEKWDTKAGMVQLVGFVLMVCGTLVHNKVVRLERWFAYETDVEVLVLVEKGDEEEDR